MGTNSNGNISHTLGDEVRLYRGDYNIVKDRIYFKEVPYGSNTVGKDFLAALIYNQILLSKEDFSKNHLMMIMLHLMIFPHNLMELEEHLLLLKKEKCSRSCYHRKFK